MPHPDDDLTPEEEQVRRLLAEARHTRPIPADVAGRLDGVLADLRHEDPADPVPVAVPATTTPPADLGAARRRRNVRSWLVAAAAVVGLGVGLNQIAQVGSGGDADSAGSADTGVAESRPDAAQNDGAQEDEPQDDGAGSSAGADEAPAPGTAARVRPVRLDSERFGAQVRRLQARSDLLRATSELASDPPADDGADLDSAFGATCAPTGWGRGFLVAVRYDGDPAALAFRQVRGDTQVVDLFLCGADEPARSITLPAP